jgi:putative DNA primase/helicase
MKFQLRDSGLYCYSSEEWQRVGGWIEVVARTRLSNKKHGHGALLQWKNMDNVLLREVVYARTLNGDNARQIRELLVDSGYPLEPGNISWARLQRYLLEEMAKAPPATTVDRTGWHGPVFATSSWTAGQADEQHYFVGQLSTSPLLQESGSLQDWQTQVGKLCEGNPLAMFSIGVALAAPLLKHAGLENGAFHFVGNSSTGKTTLLQVAAEHNDITLMLDEIGLARPEDVDVSIYHIMNGASKLRANISGDLAAQTHWRTLALSTGEIWLSEVFQQLEKPVRAGQENRLVEIPTFGRFGAFDELHVFANSQELVDALKSRTRHYHGTLFRHWLERLTEDADDLPEYIQRETARLTDQWTTSHMASQVVRVVKRFALITAALCLACRNYLLPWTEEESERAVHQVADAWIKSRGHIFNKEEHRILLKLNEYMNSRRFRFADIEKGIAESPYDGFKRTVSGEKQLLVKKTNFLQFFGLQSRYMREIEFLIQKDLLETNERSRGTLRVKVNGRFERFFALWPDRIRNYLNSLSELDGLSQFPTFPSGNPEVAEDE